MFGWFGRRKRREEEEARQQRAREEAMEANYRYSLQHYFDHQKQLELERELKRKRIGLHVTPRPRNSWPEPTRTVVHDWLRDSGPG